MSNGKNHRSRRRVPDGERWEDRNKRYTAILPLDLIEKIKVEAKRSKCSQSHVVREALEARLTRRGLAR
jgi:hypothetical protein